MRLSATYHPILFVMNKAIEMLPTAISIKTVYVDNSKNLYLSDVNGNTMLSDQEKVQYQSFRSSKSNMRWLPAKYEINNFSPKKGQIEITSETINRTLSLSFISPIDGFKDVMFIELPKVFNLYNQQNDLGSMSTSEKDIIAFLLYQGFLYDYNRIVEEAKVLKQFTRVQEGLKQKAKRTNLELDELKLVQKEFISELISNLIEKKSFQLNIELQLDTSFVEALTELKLNVDKLTTLVEEAIDTAYNLNFGANKVVIDDNYLLELNIEEEREPIKDRALEILDSYEESARRCLMAGLKITGKNVAGHLEPPVSPPAITDAVKKNAKRIAFYLDKHPTRWKNIRNGLKPLQNLLVNKIAS